MQFRPGDIVALFGEVIEAGGKLKIRPVNAAIEDEIIIADPSDIRKRCFQPTSAQGMSSPTRLAG